MIRTTFIEAEAAKLLRDAQILRPPVPVDAVASHLALRIVRGATLKQGVRAHFEPSTRTIFVAQLSVRSERFAIAHELGHVQLDHGGACSFEGEPSVDAVALEDADVRIDEEAEADDFAGRLLVPRPWLRERIRRSAKDELLADFEINLPVLLIAATRYRIFGQLQA